MGNGTTPSIRERLPHENIIALCYFWMKPKFGKGRHPAGLNIGDCCSYALAKCSGEPLLFKGDDFSQTDIKTA